MGTKKKWTAELKAEYQKKILDDIALEGMSLRQSVKQEGYPDRTVVYEWLEEDKTFAHHYARACEERADLIADEILTIADDGSRDNKTIKSRSGEDYTVEDTEWTNRSKLRVDSRKWLLSKLFPKKYGDKLDITSDNEKIQPVTVVEIVRPKD